MANATALSTFVSAGAGTVAIWYRASGTPPTGDPTEHLSLLFGDTDGYFGLFRGNYNSTGDRVYANLYDGAEKAVGGPVTVGQYDHWALTFNGTTLTLYRNGDLQDSVAAGNIQVTTGTIRVGRSRLDSYLTGDVSRLATWNVALTSAELTQLASGDAPATVHASGLTGDWRLAGTTSPEPDLAAGNHALTLTGTTSATDPLLSGFYPRQRNVTANVISADNASASFAITPIAGNLVTVTIEGFRDAGSGGFDMPNGGVTDNQGNTYTRAVQSALAGDGSSRSAIFYAYNIVASGTFTVTVDPTGTGNTFSWVMSEIAGATTADPLDKTTSNSGSSTSPTTGTTATLTQADEIAYAALAVASTATITADSASPNWDTVFEEESAVTGVPGSINRRIVAATTAQSCSWTLGTTSVWSASIATFKADTAGPPPQLFVPRVNVLLRL